MTNQLSKPRDTPTKQKTNQATNQKTNHPNDKPTNQSYVFIYFYSLKESQEWVRTEWPLPDQSIPSEGGSGWGDFVLQRISDARGAY